MTTHDLIGIGIGPFNLSLAAQLDGVGELRTLFLERKPAFSWHPGMMLPGVELQTSFLKDLVTLTNPTSPWSFIAYLVAHKRLLDFLNAEFDAVPRQEFANYLAWVAARLPSLRFGAEVREVSFEESLFELRTQNETFRTRNIALGIGLKPHVPVWARTHLGAGCFHSSAALDGLDGLAARRVAVIGGGQSGAEIVAHLLSGAAGGVSEVLWLSRRDNFEPLDDTPFVNEYFTPGYAEAFGELPPTRKRALVSRQKLASDGASLSTLRAIRRAIYRHRHLEDGAARGELAPCREILDMTRAGTGYRMAARNGLTGSAELHHADAVVLATGYRNAVPDFLEPLRPRLAGNGAGGFDLDQAFRARWDGPADRAIFVQNGGRLSRGIFDPQLSLMAWRSACIVNALAQRPVFDLDMGAPALDWGPAGAASQARFKASA